MNLRRILLDPQGGEGSPTASLVGAPAPAPAPAPADPAGAFAALLAKHNQDAASLARMLHDENYKLRQKNNSLRSAAPAEGAVVLQGDDAKEWSRYRDLGKSADLKQVVEQGRAATEERDRLVRNESYRRVAERLGWKASVFGALAERDRLAVEFVEGKVKGSDGKAVEVAVVKGEGDTTTPIDEYVDKHWSDFKPALVGGPDGAARKPPGGTPPRRPVGQGPPALDADPDQSIRDRMRATGLYAGGL